MAKITYENKVALNPQPSVANKNKVSDADMNEIKSSVNDLYDNVSQNKTDIDTYVDARVKSLYSVFKNTGANTSTTITVGSIDRAAILVFGTNQQLGSALAVITSSSSTTNIKNLGTITLTATRNGNVITIGGLTNYSYIMCLSANSTIS